jgi:6-phosphogluconolactonase
MRTFTSPHEHEIIITAAGVMADAITDRKGSPMSIGIVGGRSIPLLLDKLLPYAPELSSEITIFWLDERIGGEKNFTAALPHLEALRQHGVNIAWHPIMETQVQPALVEVHHIEEELQSRLPLDLIIASAGEDGHVASLFPNHPLLQETRSGYAHEAASPKPPKDRLTVTPPVLVSAKRALLFFVGEKKAAYAAFSDAAVSAAQCPVKLLLSVPQLDVFVSVR